MEIFLRYPVPTLLLVLGGAVMTGAVGTARHERYVLSLTLGALGVVTLINAGRMMLGTPEWDSSSEGWGAVATEGRQRTNFFVVAVGTMTAGLAASWFGFGPGGIVSGILLVGGGWAILLCGVIFLVGWVKARQLFG